MGENFFHFCKEPEEGKGEEGKQASIYDVHTPQTVQDDLLQGAFVQLRCSWGLFVNRTCEHHTWETP